VGTFDLQFIATATEAVTGDSASTTDTLTVTLLARNAQPTAPGGSVTTVEDTPYVFQWSDFGAADSDGPELHIFIESLPDRGKLQYLDGSEWVYPDFLEVSRSDIEAGKLRFVPRENESGFDGYATEGEGDGASDYASFLFTVCDGQDWTDPLEMTIDVTPVVDAPHAWLWGAGQGEPIERFYTGWESVANPNAGATAVQQSALEGWTLVTGGDALAGGQDVFEIWSTGDLQTNSSGVGHAVAHEDEEPGSNWLELNDAGGTAAQTLGIERTLTTVQGAVYELWVNYAAAMDFSEEYTGFAVYVDGVLLDTFAHTSPEDSLYWKWRNFQFVGTGAPQTIRIMADATAFMANGHGAMIDNIELWEQVPNVGYQNQAIELQDINAALRDQDESETLSVVISGIPVGATLSDGTTSFTATAGQTSVDITGWERWSGLLITPPTDFVGSFVLTASVTSTETTGSSATSTLQLTVTVLEEEFATPIAIDLNGDGVRTVSLRDSTGRFDLLNTGHAIRSGWLSGSDGFLAIDANGNGRIDDRSELFGGQIGEGFARLASFDSNRDGVVDANDARFSELLIWQDSNGNHQTDSGELRSLTQAGLASLQTGYRVDPTLQNGNWLVERSTATFSDGRSTEMVDAYFAVEPAATRSELDRGATITVKSILAERNAIRVKPPGSADYFPNGLGPFGGKERPTENPPTPEPAAARDKRRLGQWRPAIDSDKYLRGQSQQGQGLQQHRVETARPEPTPAVIDWSPGARDPLMGIADWHRRFDWLPDFLGTQREEKRDLVKLTGLKVKIPSRPHNTATR
jgi:hypothetical protein